MISYWNDAGQKTAVQHLKNAKRGGKKSYLLKILYPAKLPFKTMTKEQNFSDIQRLKNSPPADVHYKKS